jgi:L-glyceraldehyde 3-phosphate reductase
MLNRRIEHDGLLDVLDEEGAGCIAFSPLAQGLLTDKYLSGIPTTSRAAASTSLAPDWLTPTTLSHIKSLNSIATERNQSLAQMAIAWTLRDPRVTSSLIGASSVSQLDNSLDALQNLSFSDDELSAIDEHAIDAGIDLWESASTA